MTTSTFKIGEYIPRDFILALKGAKVEFIGYGVTIVKTPDTVFVLRDKDKGYIILDII